MNIKSLLISLVFIYITLVLISLTYKRISGNNIYFSKYSMLIILALVIAIYRLNNLQSNVFHIILTNILTIFGPMLILFRQENSKDVIFYGLIFVVISLLFYQLLFYVIIDTIYTDSLIRNKPYIACMLSSFLIFLMYITMSIPLVKRKINSFYVLLKSNKVSISYIIICMVTVYFLSLVQINIDLNIIEKHIFFLITILIISIMTYGLIIKSKYNMLRKYTKNMLTNIRGNNKKFEEYLIEKHNINNFLISLLTLDEEDFKSKIQQYLIDHNAKNFNSNSFINLIPKGISGFIYNKISNNQSINVITIGEKILEDININHYNYYNEICESLGIMLDNAFEATKEANADTIYIEVTKENEESYISIYNKFKNNISIEDLGSANYTTKPYGKGLGLYSINNYKNINISYSIINDFFRAKIKILK